MASPSPLEERRREVKNLLTVSIEEKRRFLDSFDHVLTDCDGTIWQFVGTISGVDKAIARLELDGKKMIYITNNSLRTDDEYLAKFRESGIRGAIENVMHPALAIVHFLKRRIFSGLIYTIGCPVFRNIIKGAGFQTIDGPNEMVDESFAALWKAIKDDHPVSAVAIDTDFNLTTAKLIRAQLYLNNPDCLFIVGTTDMCLPIKNFKIMGPGAFYKIVESATGRKPIIVGKPGLDLADIVVDKFKLRHRKRVLFIGDMLEQDVGFGNASGFQSLLVLTGGTSLNDLHTHLRCEELPDYYLESFADFSKVYDEIEKGQN